MSQTLYRKYRPQVFDDLVNQNHIRAVLTHEIETGDIAHAYLFAGPRGVGKTTVARLMAKAVNCTDRHGFEPCNKCAMCMGMNQGRLLDVIEIDAASHTQVDNVRENIIPNARTAPSQAKWKVFIIDEVHMLSVSAFNALLKIIEEPPAPVIFIMATTEVHRVPETIISRCQRFDFRKLTPRDIAGRLDLLVQRERRSVDEDVLLAIARLADGSVRDAESMLGQVLSLGEKKISWDVASLVLPRSDLNEVTAFIEYIFAHQLRPGIEQVNRLVDEGMDMPFFARDVLEFLRWCLLRQTGSGAERFSSVDAEAVPAKLNDLIVRTKPEQTLLFIEALTQAQRELRDSPMPQFPFELALMKLFADEFTAEQSNHDGHDVIPPAASIDGPQKKSAPPAPPKKTAHHASVTVKKNPETGSLTNGQVEAVWPEFVAEVRRSNPSLAIVMQSSVFFGLEDGAVLIGCPYKFHLERLNEAKIRHELEEKLTGHLKQPVQIRAVLQDISEPKAEAIKISAKPREENTDTAVDLWQQVLTSFGVDAAK